MEETQALIQWFWSEYRKAFRNTSYTDGLCQCEIERFIEEADQPGLIRSFLMLSVFIDQRMYTDFQFLYEDFRSHFCFPRLYSCPTAGMASPNWVISVSRGYDSKMNWQDMERIAAAVLGELFNWLQRHPNGDELAHQFMRQMKLEIWAGFDSENAKRLLEAVRQLDIPDWTGKE